MRYIEATLTGLVKEDVQTNNFIVYLFCKEESSIIPIKLCKFYAKCLANASKEKNSYSFYHIFNCVAEFAGIRLDHIRIYFCEKNNFYAYLRVTQDGKPYDFNISTHDALGVSIKNKCPILVREDVVLSYGIKVSKELFTEQAKFTDI